MSWRPFSRLRSPASERWTLLPALQRLSLLICKTVQLSDHVGKLRIKLRVYPRHGYLELDDGGILLLKLCRARFERVGPVLKHLDAARRPVRRDSKSQG